MNFLKSKLGKKHKLFDRKNTKIVFLGEPKAKSYSKERELFLESIGLVDFKPKLLSPHFMYFDLEFNENSHLVSAQLNCDDPESYNSYTEKRFQKRWYNELCEGADAFILYYSVRYYEYDKIEFTAWWKSFGININRPILILLNENPYWAEHHSEEKVKASLNQTKSNFLFLCKDYKCKVMFFNNKKPFDLHKGFDWLDENLGEKKEIVKVEAKQTKLYTKQEKDYDKISRSTPLYLDNWKIIFYYLFSESNEAAVKNWRSIRSVSRELNLIADKLFNYQKAEKYFYLSVRNNNLEAVSFFISNGINPASEKGIEVLLECKSAFCYAASRGYMELFNYLLSDPRVDPSAEAQHAIRMASANGHIQIVKELLKRPQVDTSSWGDWAYTMAKENGHGKVARLLSDHNKSHKK